LILLAERRTRKLCTKKYQLEKRYIIFKTLFYLTLSADSLAMVEGSLIVIPATRVAYLGRKLTVPLVTSKPDSNTNGGAKSDFRKPHHAARVRHVLLTLPTIDDKRSVADVEVMNKCTSCSRRSGHRQQFLNILMIV
jgi:hypothetical protein